MYQAGWSFVFLALVASTLAVKELYQNPNPPDDFCFVMTGSNSIQLDPKLSEAIVGSFTFEAWIRVDNTGTRTPIVARFPAKGGDDYANDFLLSLDEDGKLNLVMGGGVRVGIALASPDALSSNSWHHVGFSVQSTTIDAPSTVHLYANGNQIATAPFPAGTKRQRMTVPTYLGLYKEGNNTYQMTGRIDEVRFWDVVRTDVQIYENFRFPLLYLRDPTPYNLVAYYPFQNEQMASIWDQSTKPWYDGVASGSSNLEYSLAPMLWPIEPDMAPSAGPLSYAMGFGGIKGDRNYARLPASLSASLPRGFTFSAWIFVEQPEDFMDGTYRPIVSRFDPKFNAGLIPGDPTMGSNMYQDFSFQLDPRLGRLVFFMGGGAGLCMQNHKGYGIWAGTDEYTIHAYRWHHVAFSVMSSNQDGANPIGAALYVDGFVVAQSSTEPGMQWKDGCKRNWLFEQPVHLGYYDNNVEQYWNGRMDEVTLWTAQQEGATIINNMFRPLAATKDGLHAYYKFDEGAGLDIHDSGPHGFHTKVQVPRYSFSSVPGHVVQAESGFPLFVDFESRSPLNGDLAVHFIVTKLPTHGGVFANEVPVQLLTQDDVANQRPLVKSLAYVSTFGFTGEDSFAYAAVSDLTGLVSQAHHVFVTVTPSRGATDPNAHLPDDCNPDICGVCNGDASSCTGGCDNRGGQLDECGVCNGDGSSCTCAVYKSFNLEEMDCVLFEFSVNRSIARLEYTIETLVNALMGLEHFTGWEDKEFDLGIQIESLVSVLKGCHPVYDRVLDEFLVDINSRSFLALPCVDENTLPQ